MVKKLRVYFEGDDRFRPGFRQFLSEIAEAARSKRCYLDLIAAEGTPVQDFQAALKSHPDAWNVLVLDSEDPQEFQLRKKSLEGGDPDSIFWMVEIMESWFLADTDALKALFGGNVTKGNPKVEEIPKVDVLAKLKRVSGGEYHKVKHGTKLLESIDPAKVRNAAPNCDRMFRLILARLG